MTIRRLRLVAFFGSLLLVAASVTVTFAALQTQRADALVINLAGRQRMLIQKMTLEVMGVKVGADPAYYEDLHDTAHDYFEQTLDALIAGGQVPYFDEATVTLPPTRDPKILAELETVRSNWEEVHSAIHVVLESDPQSSAFAGAVGEVERLSPLMLAQMDEAVRLYEAEAARKVARVQYIQLGFLTAAVALLVIAFLLSERWVLGPIDQLGAAARRIGVGDLETPVPVAGPGEIARMARSLDETRGNLAASRGEQARLYAQAQERLERISALHDIDVAITAPLGLSATLEVLLEKVTDRLHVDTAAVALAAAVAFIDQETRELVYVAKRGLNGEFFVDGLLKVKEGIAGQVAHTGQVATVPDVRAEPGFVRGAIAERLGIVSYLAVPLRARGRILGVLELATRQPHTFASEEVDFFVTLAGQAAIVIDNSQMYEEAVRRATQQHTLAESASGILATLDVESLWPAVTDAARQALAADRAAIYLYHADTDRLTCPYASGLSAEYVAEINRRFREVPGGRLLADPRPVVTADAQTDPAAAPVRDLAAREGFHSYGVFPLMAPGLPLGALVVYRNVVAPFSPDDVTTGQTLAHIAAVALQNTWLYRQANQRLSELEFLHRTTQAVAAAPNLDAALKQVAVMLADELGYQHIGIALVDEARQSVDLRAEHGIPVSEWAPAGQSLQMGQGLVGWVVQHGEPLLVNDVTRDPRYLAGIPETCSELVVPLRAGERVIGVINVESPMLDAFDAKDLRLLSTLAGHLAATIERGRLFDETRRRADELAAITRVSREIIAVPHLQHVLASIARHAAGLSSADAGGVFAVRPDGSLYIAAGYGVGDEFIAAINAQGVLPGQGAIGRAADERQPVQIPDILAEPGYSFAQVAEMEHIRAILTVPMLRGEEVVGGIVLWHRQPHRFPPQEVAFAQALAQQSVNAVENARLFEAERAAREQAETLREAVGAVSSSLELDEVLRQILGQLKRVLDYSTASVLLLGEGGVPSLVTGAGYADEKFTSRASGDLLGSSPILRRMAADLQPVVIADVRQHPGWIWVPGAEHVRAFMSVPIVAYGRMIGALMVDSVRPGFFEETHVRLAQSLAQHMAVAIENARLFETVRKSEERYRTLVEQASDGIFVADSQGRYMDVNPSGCAMLGYLREEILSLGLIDLLPAEDIAAAPLRLDELRAGKTVVNERRLKRKDGALLPVEISARMLPDGRLQGIVRDITERKQAEEALRHRAEELEALTAVSAALRQARTREAMLPVLVEKTTEALRADAGALVLLEDEALVFAAARGPGEALLGIRLASGDDPLWQVIRTGRPLFIADVSEHPEFDQWGVGRTLMAGMTACTCVPLQTAEGAVGLLHLARRSRREATEQEKRLLAAIAEMAGNAIHRTALHDETERRLQLVEALRNIDMAITASLDVRVTLNVFLDQATAQLRVDAAAVLLLDPHTQFLEYAAGRGFRSSAIEHSRLRLGEGYAGRAALERQAFHLPELSKAEDYVRASLLGGEDFVGYYVTPLVVKGHVKGVFEMLHRAPLHLSPIWLSFLEALAAQASIAVDNAGLYDDLQRSNAELALAYDTTLEGWARTLELRDRETEGHTRRVTEMTERLASAMGITGGSLIHIRRGALLHDIGKMGIPDSILLKPGPLADEEWALMRQHPIYAYQLLSPIGYLGPALDIPYCHHEKWDGTGYPRGLKGEQIPLAARLFAVVDVWDALSSDRPYRRGWPAEKVREYLREQAGKHFDPKVVDVFLGMLGEE